MSTTYRIYNCDVIDYSGNRAIISDEDFDKFLHEFDIDTKFIYIKIDRTYIPVFPSRSVPLDTVAITKEQSEKHSIETPTEDVFIADPEMIKWL